MRVRVFVRLGALFVGFVLLSFTLLLPKPASSAFRNSPASSCFEQRNDFPPFSATYNCSLMVDSTTYTVAALTQGSFDFVCSGAGQIGFLWLTKHTFTGSSYMDSAGYSCTGTEVKTVTVSAIDVKTNASTNDYLAAGITNVAQLYGIRTSH